MSDVSILIIGIVGIGFLTEFGGKGEGSKNRLHKPVEENENEKIIRF